MYDLALIEENLAFMVRYELSQLDMGQSHPEEGERLTKLGFYYRSLGINAFLRDGDLVGFVHNLHKAAHARIAYLQRVQAGQADGTSRFNTTHHNRAFYDALAIYDNDAAQALARLCPDRWDPDREYEDDFLVAAYMQALALALAGTETDPSPAEVLERLAGVVGSDEPPEYRVCVALTQRDAAAFDAALRDYIDHRDHVLAENLALPPEYTHTAPFVWIEGLGILRLAQRQGLEINDEYPMLPGLLVALPQLSLPEASAWRVGTR